MICLLIPEFTEIMRSGDPKHRDLHGSLEAAATCHARRRGRSAAPLPLVPPGPSRATIPYLTEPWYCWFEPTNGQLACSWSFTAFSTSESTSIRPPVGLPANLSGLLSKPSYGNSAVSKKAGRAGKYGPRIVAHSEPCGSVRRCEKCFTSIQRQKEMTNADYKRCSRSTSEVLWRERPRWRTR